MMKHEENPIGLSLQEHRRLAVAVIICWMECSLGRCLSIQDASARIRRGVPLEVKDGVSWLMKTAVGKICL